MGGYRFIAATRSITCRVDPKNFLSRKKEFLGRTPNSVSQEFGVRPSIFLRSEIAVPIESKVIAMRSVFYVEDDFVAGLLKQYFVGNENSTFFVRRPSNGNLTQQIDAHAIDLFLAQSEDPDRLTKVLESVNHGHRKVPTLVLTSQPDRIPEKYKSFAHFVSLPELLESNFPFDARACAARVALFLSRSALRLASRSEAAGL